MIQDTSREAYASVRPVLTERQAAVLGVLEGAQPMTNAEIAEALGWTINRVTPRTGELRELGLVAEAGKRACRVNGRRAIAWVLAAAVPKKRRVEYQPVSIDGVTYMRPVEV